MHDDAPEEIGSEENAVLVVPFREDNAGERTRLLGEITPLNVLACLASRWPWLYCVPTGTRSVLLR